MTKRRASVPVPVGASLAAVALVASGVVPEVDRGAKRTRVRLVRAIARCRRCKVAHSILIVRATYRSESRRFAPGTGVELWPEVRHTSRRWTLDGVDAEVTRMSCRCPGFQVGKPYVDVDGRVREDEPCGSRCMASRGPSCECACGGANHGASHG